MNPQGVVVGGWEYVWMAYGVTLAAFLIYGVMLVVKLRAELARAKKDGETR